MQNVKTTRNARVRTLAKKGLSYSEIGRVVGVTKQRVHQIIKLSTSPKLDARNVQEYNATRIIGS